LLVGLTWCLLANEHREAYFKPTSVNSKTKDKPSHRYNVISDVPDGMYLNDAAPYVIVVGTHYYWHMAGTYEFASS
jgi:hypothetical protein